MSSSFTVVTFEAGGIVGMQKYWNEDGTWVTDGNGN
jgi:hypothetical protein